MASLPPTGFLPSLVRLQTLSAFTIVSALENLQSFYWPLPVVARKLDPLIHDDSVPDSGYASAEEEDDEDGYGDAEYARSDPLERDYAIKWITRLIARGEAWVEDDETRRDILDDAARILSLFACNTKEEEECAVQRSFDFPNDVHVELNDAPLSVSDHTSVGLQSWASSILLAERMCASPADFCLFPGARILELGAGTGLLSIASAKLVQADIVVATDYYRRLRQSPIERRQQMRHSSKGPTGRRQTMPVRWTR